MNAFMSTPIVKPVDFACNLSCSYCYTKDNIGDLLINSVMDYSTLASTIDFFCSSQNNIEFIWHGGEPLLAGIEFYTKAIEYQSHWLEKGKNITNSIQTNGTLVDDKWANFFKNNMFRVGVSLDGIPNHHNNTRRYKNNSCSFNDVMRGIRLLQESGNFSGVICCVNEFNYKYPAEIFDFFIANGISKIKFNRLRGKINKNHRPTHCVPFKDYITFLTTILDLWLVVDNLEIEIRELQCIIELLLGGTNRDCVLSGECYKYCTVYSDGSIFSCDTLPRRKDLCFGNVSHNPEDVSKSLTFQKFLSTCRVIRDQCMTCNWNHICKGGCLQDWSFDRTAQGFRNAYCRDMKVLFESVKSILTKHNLI